MRPKILGLIAVLSVVALSCKKEKTTTTTKPPDQEISDPYKDYTTYTIQKGKNYCDNNTYTVMENIDAMDFSVVFDSTCVYSNADPVNQADINKLMGFSDCNTLHQANSARFGWNWMEGRIYLYAYCYNNSERIYKTLAAVPLNQPQHLKMYVAGNYYVFQVNGKNDSVPRHCSSNTITGYKLLPYFGGDETAPQTVNIRIKYQ
jgi:hypothetical protein